jgi:rubrerythrin
MSEKLLDALLKAEELELEELEGKQFYLKAAEKTLIPSVKELFKHLAYEEDLHLFFDLKQLEKVAGVETDIAALEEALSFEEKSIKYYQKLSEKIKDPKVKRFF